MDRYRVILADDHSMVRRGIKMVLQEMADIDVIGEAKDGLELLEIVEKTKPDLIILDISMPHMKGTEAATKIKQLNRDIKIIILSMHESKELLNLAIAAGVDGYLVKRDADVELEKAVKAIKAGKKYISPLLSQELTSLCFGKLQWDSQSKFKHITRRENEVLHLIADGKTNGEIANLLFISIRTVHRHRTNIMKKLNLNKSADLLRYAIIERYVP